MKIFTLLLVAVAARGAVIDTLPADSSVGTFGAAGFGTPLYGWSFTVPAGVTQLVSVEFSINGQLTLQYTANICLFTGTQCAGAALWSSGTLSGTGTGVLAPVIVNPALGVTSGQLLMFYLSASGGQGTGRLGVNTESVSADNIHWFQNGTNPQNPWGQLPGGLVVAAREVFSTDGGGGGGGGETNTPEPATFVLASLALVGMIISRRNRAD